MNILVTGGYGFIGSNFINFIAKKEEVKSILNIDSMTYAANKDNVIPSQKFIQSRSID
jgi:dTDP-glucose 4,6-dehydratase